MKRQKTEYRIMFTKDGVRDESYAYTRKDQAIKDSEKLKKEGCTDIFIDVFGPAVRFNGTKDYDDIVWLGNL